MFLSLCVGALMCFITQDAEIQILEEEISARDASDPAKKIVELESCVLKLEDSLSCVLKLEDRTSNPRKRQGNPGVDR